MNQNPVDEPSESGRSRYLHFAVFLGLIALSFGLYRAFGLGEYLSQERMADTLQAVRAWAQAAGAGGFLLFWLGGVVAIVVNIPSVLVIAAAAVIYGALGAVALGFLCLNTAAVIIFWLSQKLGREFVSSVFRHSMRRLEAHFRDRGLITVIHMRLLFFALPPVNWFLGVMNLSFRDFMLGTALGSLPKIILFSWLGGVIFDKLARADGSLTWHSPELIVPMGVGVMLSLMLRIADRLWLAPRGSVAR
ncbi:MAG: VTT domain-containing protein [Pseudomonadota bacterium]|nr:VTT domain-containing protein [Pseudomonadota bacterium]